MSKSKTKTWDKKEDEYLLHTVKNMGIPVKWSVVAQVLPGRTNKQCRERYVNHLNPKLKNDKWTPREDAAIFHLHKSIGPKWASMSKLIPGRTDNGIKNRYHNLKSKLKRQVSSIIHSERCNY